MSSEHTLRRDERECARHEHVGERQVNVRLYPDRRAAAAAGTSSVIRSAGTSDSSTRGRSSRCLLRHLGAVVVHKAHEYETNIIFIVLETLCEHSRVLHESGNMALLIKIRLIKR